MLERVLAFGSLAGASPNELQTGGGQRLETPGRLGVTGDDGF